MVWGCFAAAGPGRLTIIESTMNSTLYQKVLEENVRPSVKKCKQNWTLQHDNDSKHTSKLTNVWLKSKKWFWKCSGMAKSMPRSKSYLEILLQETPQTSHS